MWRNATSGVLLRWFKDQFSPMEVERRLTIDAYHILDEQAAKIMPGSGGLIVLPYFSGERTPIHEYQQKTSNHSKNILLWKVIS